MAQFNNTMEIFKLLENRIVGNATKKHALHLLPRSFKDKNNSTSALIEQ
jgi:hypothetical protein